MMEKEKENKVSPIVLVVLLIVLAAGAYAMANRKGKSATDAHLTWDDIGLVGGANTSSFRVYRVSVDGQTFYAFAGANKLSVIAR